MLGAAACDVCENPEAPSVVFFRSSSEAALEWVREEAYQRSERVLVVALDAKRLQPLEHFRFLRAGAKDVLPGDASGTWAGSVAERLRRWQAVNALVESDAVRRTLVGESAVWKRVMRQVAEVAAYNDAPLLVMGETGTGKELIARMIHELDLRRDKRDFIVLDCTTVVSELSGSEFFGHEKGAFTGAVSARNGAFAMADNGTLFLDEMGELPLPLQAELLRVVQERTYKRVGGSAWQSTRFRLVCATNRDLESERDAGRFRPDLWYRISGWSVSLPPLRERREDILPLARHFLAQCLPSAPRFDDAVRHYLLNRDFPGNVRELRHLVSRLAHRHVGAGPITVGDLGQDAEEAMQADAVHWSTGAFQESIGKALSLGVGLKEIGRVAEDIAVSLAIRSEAGSLQQAARRLGVTDRALQLRRASQRALEPSPESP
jgi:transcriptional regulator with GAF, ATPase, and Fis domain